MDAIRDSDADLILICVLRKASQHPRYSHTLTPDAPLLFRYSALMFNAHAIHLDPHYTRHIEGHRNLLVHGPLSLTLMLTALRYHLLEKEPRRVIREIEYRNLVPLYAGEEMRVCGRKKNGEGEWEIWCEGRDGGYAVRGSVSTEDVGERKESGSWGGFVY